MTEQQVIEEQIEADVPPEQIAQAQKENFLFLEEAMAGKLTLNGIDAFLPVSYELGQVLNHHALERMIRLHNSNGQDSNQ